MVSYELFHQLKNLFILFIGFWVGICITLLLISQIFSKLEREKPPEGVALLAVKRNGKGKLYIDTNRWTTLAYACVKIIVWRFTRKDAYYEARDEAKIARFVFKTCVIVVILLIIAFFLVFSIWGSGSTKNIFFE